MVHRLVGFILLFLSGIQILGAQTKFDLLEAKTFLLDLKNEHDPGSSKIPFNKIIVRDVRFDTTKLGYVKSDGIRKIVTGKNSSAELTGMLNEYYKHCLTPAANKSLVIYIKTLWMQKDPDIVDETAGNKIKHDVANMKTIDDVLGGCHAEIEVFSLMDSSLCPVIKIKDNFYYYPYNARNIRIFFLLPFDSLIRKIPVMDIENLLPSRKKFSPAEVNNSYLTRFDLPILHNTGYRKGVFLTFESFKKNKPDYIDFFVKESKLTDEVYAGSDASGNLLTDYWGFFDGKDFYIKSGFSIFKLTRQNNTWDIWGNKYININSSSNSGHVSPPSGETYGFNTLSLKSKIEYKALQLNMDTGKLY